MGQITRAVKQRVAEQLKTANIKNFTIVLNESAERDDGTLITGPIQQTFAVPLGRLLFFERQERP